MSIYFEPIKTSLILFPVLAMFLTLPFAIYQYRKYGYINKLRVLVSFSFIFYMITAYYMVILPLPENRQVERRQDIDYYNFKPFKFVEDIKREGKLDLSNPKTYPGAIRGRAFLQVLLNVVLTLPFGVYLRYFLKRSLGETIVLSFLLSLFYETTQITGIFGIYSAPYRVFDVDDLLMNTLGGSLGYLIAPIFTFFLPKYDEIDRDLSLEDLRVGYIRRFIALSIDLGFLNLLPNFKERLGYRLAYYFLYFIVVAYITNGRSLGNFLTRIRVKGQGDRIRLGEILKRNIVFVVAVLEVGNFLDYITRLKVTDNNYYLIIGLLLFVLVYGLSLFVHYLGSIIRKEDFFYEKASSTKFIVDSK